MAGAGLGDDKFQERTQVVSRHQGIFLIGEVVGFGHLAVRGPAVEERRAVEIEVMSQLRRA